MHEELDRNGLNEVLGDADIHVPVFAVQRAHGRGGRGERGARCTMRAKTGPVVFLFGAGASYAVGSRIATLLDIETLLTADRIGG